MQPNVGDTIPIEQLSQVTASTPAIGESIPINQLQTQTQSTPIFNQNATDAVNAGSDYGKKLLSDYGNDANQFSDINQHTADQLNSIKGQKLFGALKGLGYLGENILRNASQGIQTVFQPFTTGISQFINYVADQESNSPTLQKVANSPTVSGALDNFNKIQNGWNQFAKDNPDIANSISSGANVIAALVGEKPAEQGFESLKQGAVNDSVSSTVNTIKNAIPTTETDADMQAMADHINSQLGLSGNKLTILQEKGIDPGKVIAEHTGAPIPEIVNESGRTVLDPNSVNDILDQNKSPAYSIIDNAIKESGNPKVSYNDFQAKAAQAIDDNPSLSAEEKLAAKQELPKIFQQSQEARPTITTNPDGTQSIPLEDVQSMKKYANGKSRFDLQTTTDFRNAMKGVARAGKGIVEDNLPDVIVKKINRALGDIEETQNILDGKNNIASKAQPGFVAKLTREGIAGLAALPFGKLPAIISGALINPVMDWVTSLPIEFRSSLLKEAIANGDTKFAELLKEGEAGVQKIKNRVDSRLKLPEGSPLGSQKNPIITPAPTTYESAAQKINRQFSPQLELPAGNPNFATPDKIINLPGENRTIFEKPTPKNAEYTYNPRDKKYYKRGK